MGMEMTGVDLTARYIRKARQLARRRRLAVRFLRGDMRAIAFENEFDAAFNWFGSFGYFSDADNLDFCRRVFKALRPGGRFLIEGLNKSWLLSHFRADHEQRVGGVLVRQRSWLSRRKSHVLTTWTFKRGGATERHTIKMRLFDGAEIREFLHAAGFREVKLFQRPLNRPFSRHSRRFIAVGRKPRKMGTLRPDRAAGAR
jgi:SAM-dependent methyltransferase